MRRAKGAGAVRRISDFIPSAVRSHRKAPVKDNSSLSSQKLYDTTSRVKERMPDWKRVREEYLLSSEISGRFKELCLLQPTRCKHGIHNSRMSAINIVKRPSQENLEKECLKGSSDWSNCEIIKYDASRPDLLLVVQPE